MSSCSSHKIKSRKKANDIFITPLQLAKINIEMIDYKKGDKWLDPCKNDGSYYNQFPTDNKDYCEILENKDFLKYNNPVDIIIQNPPYSIMDIWIQKNIDLNPRIISFLIGVNNLTTRRLEWLYDAGYGLTKLKMLKVWKWYGMSYIVVFEKDKPTIMEIDRKVWREDKYKKNNDKVIEDGEEYGFSVKPKRKFKVIKKLKK